MINNNAKGFFDVTQNDSGAHFRHPELVEGSLCYGKGFFVSLRMTSPCHPELVEGLRMMFPCHPELVEGLRMTVRNVPECASNVLRRAKCASPGNAQLGNTF